MQTNANKDKKKESISITQRKEEERKAREFEFVLYNKKNNMRDDSRGQEGQDQHTE